MSETSIRNRPSRYRELWVEIVFARILAAAAAGALVSLVVKSVLGRWVPAAKVLGPVVLAAGLAAPTAVAKRWKRAFPAAAGGALAAMIAVRVVYWAYAGATPPAWIFLAAAGAAVGLAEGAIDHSASEAYGGLVDGALGGVLAGLFVLRAGDRLQSLSFVGQDVVYFASAFVVIHLGVGLGLGFGRQLRALAAQKRQGKDSP